MITTPIAISKVMNANITPKGPYFR